MKIERSLQINVAMLAIASNLLFAMGQHDSHLPVLVVVSAVASLWLTDARGWLRLNRLAATVLAVAVFALLARRMFSWDNVDSIRTIARLLVYLQVILLFERKDSRVYWQLIVLSLLLLVVATVFNQGFLFGLLMVVYLFLAISAMALLFLYRESRRHAPAESRPTGASGATSSRRWPLGAEKSFAAGDVDSERIGTHGGRDFLRQLARMGLGTLGFTAVVFFILPRFGQPAWRSPFYQQRRMVGYSGRVELGELGRVVEDPAEVLRIEFAEIGTGRLYPVDGNIYLHGTVLTHYADKTWSLPDAPQWAPRLRAVVEQPPGEIVVQTVAMEPTDRCEVFCVQPFFTLDKRRNLWYDPIRQSLHRAPEACAERFRFRLRTNAFRDGHQKTICPAPSPPYDPESLLQLPRGRLPTLVARADRWMAESGLPESSRMDRARYLANKLRDSDEFHYSLEKQPRDEAIDPIEDFVKNHPRGHCEYFATALTLMLRSQGIPARLIVGYKSDEFNPLGNFFQVRQLHAHTWVEVYLPPDQVPLNETQIAAGKPIWANGAWFRLDPTPGGDAERLGAAGRLLATAGKGVDWLQYAWNNYVMEMDRSRQRRAVYQPLLDWVKDTYQRLTSLEWWKETFRHILSAIDPRNWNLDAWFSWRGGLIGMGICLAAVVFHRIARRLGRRLGAWIGRRRAAQAARTRVDFYQRFLTLLRRRGMRRLVGQTPREFAQAVGARLAAEPAHASLVPLPEQIAEAFYEVRFGRHPLDKGRRETVEQALARLEEALDRRRARPRQKETTAP